MPTFRLTLRHRLALTATVLSCLYPPFGGRGYYAGTWARYHGWLWSNGGGQLDLATLLLQLAIILGATVLVPSKDRFLAAWNAPTASKREAIRAIAALLLFAALILIAATTIAAFLTLWFYP